MHDLSQPLQCLSQGKQRTRTTRMMLSWHPSSLVFLALPVVLCVGRKIRLAQSVCVLGCVTPTLL